MSEDERGARDEILEALGLALLIVDEAGGVSPASRRGVEMLAPEVSAAAISLAHRAGEKAIACSVRLGDRVLMLEARPLGAKRTLIKIEDCTAARARREAIAIAEDEATRAMVTAVLEPLVRDRAAEALASIRGASEALDRAVATLPPGSGKGLDVASRAAAEAEARIKALLGAARGSGSAAPGAAPFDLEVAAAAVVARHRDAFSGRARLRHAGGPARWCRADAPSIERALGLFLESIALRVDPEHSLDNKVTIVTGEAQGRPFLDVQIVGHLIPERAVAADDLVRRALGGGATAFLAARALAASGGGDLARATDPAGHLAYRLALPPASSLAAPAPGLARRARVLAIDDEPMLVTAYQRMMRRSHDIVPMVGGAAALDLLRVDRAFDLILCDLVMPQVSGMDVYNAVRKSWPELTPRFVFLSGGAYTQAARAFLEESGARCLDKPVEVPTLLAVIAASLVEKK